MKTDNVQQYIALREALLSEKTQLEERLAQINEVLGGGDRAAKVRAAKVVLPVVPPKRGRKVRRRLRNKLSLREAVRQVTSEKAMTKQEILDAVQKLGYKFQTKNPLNSLGTVLYSKKQFKNRAGKFSAA